MWGEKDKRISDRTDIPQRQQLSHEIYEKEGPAGPEPIMDEVATRKMWRDWGEHAGSDAELPEDAEKRGGGKAA